MTKHRIEWIEVARMASGMNLRIAVHVLEGSRPGPTVAITAGIHGDELPPIEICRRIVEKAQGQEIAGRLLVIPVCNPLSFESFTRNTPTDMLNLNRVFPGTADSWISELMARALVGYLEERAEVLLDLHAGGSVPTVDYVYVLNHQALSRSFLFPTLYQGSSYTGSLGTHMIDRKGIPVVVAEIGGGGQFDSVYLERGQAGLENALRFLGVFPGAVIPAPRQTLLTRMAIVRPQHGGILEPVVTAEQLGEQVAAGTVLGRVRDAQTFELLEEFRAPFEPTHMVLVRHTWSKVHPGDYAYMLGEVATAQVLPAG